jgi:ADP-heptose:LPS heptosyltransferase
VSGTPRILVFAQGGHADSLRAVPFVRAVRKAYPDAHIAVLGYGFSQELWESCPYVDRFVQTGPDGILGRGRVAKALKVGRAIKLAARLFRGYDVFLNLEVQAEGGFPGLLAVLAEIPVRIGHGNWRQGVNRSPGPADMRVPYEERASELVALLGVTEVDPRLEAWSGEADRRAVAALLGEAGRRPGQRLVVCHSGSDWSCQMWPARSWARLAEELVRRWDACVAFTGTAPERDFVAAVAASSAAPIVDLTGRTTYGELCALLQSSDLVVGLDTLVAPLAAAMGARVVTLTAYDTSNWSASRLRELGAISRYELTPTPPWSVSCHWRRIGRVRGCRSDSCVGIHGMARILPEHVLEQVEAVFNSVPAARGEPVPALESRR